MAAPLRTLVAGGFSWLRNHARSNELRLVDVAQSVIDANVVPEPPDGVGSRKRAARKA
jgi:hypothetical protein